MCLYAEHISAKIIKKGRKSFDTFSARLRFLIQFHQTISAVTFRQPMSAIGAFSDCRMGHISIFKISIFSVIICFYSHFKFLFILLFLKQRAYIPSKNEKQYFF